ncbi:hypothetical protein GALL_502170 [mine drainage metagenome]|uniref:Uncharacterized protein n=1 Tax=mine drainage metagenome TaxID=410659 RepID=A0A1J5PAF3_9ZZZZ
MALESFMISVVDSAISAASSSTSLEFAISLLSACRYSSSCDEASLTACLTFSSVDGIACSAVSTNFRRAIALAATD